MLKLIKITNSELQGYFYIPENSTPGIIGVDTVTGEVFVSVESTYDIDLGYPYYANKARGLVKQMMDSGELPDEKFYAWG